MRPDARPQAWESRRRIRWNTFMIFSGRARRRWSGVIRRSRKVNVGQAPREGDWLIVSQKLHEDETHCRLAVSLDT